MAVPSNTYKTYETVGAKESFESIITNISPTDTPFYSMLPKKSIDAKHHEWQVDELAAAAANAQLEGDDTTATAAVPTEIFDNYTQILKKSFRVSMTNQAIAKHGRGKDEFNYQAVKNGEELKRDIEFALTQNSTYNAGAAATARQLRGLEGWIATNNELGASGAAPDPTVGTNTAATDGTQRAFTEALLRAAQKQAWEEGGNPSILMVGPYNRGVVDGFTGAASREIDAKSKKAIGTIEVYEGPFGKLKIVANRFQRDRTAFLLDKEYWALGVLRPMNKVKLAVTGDSQPGHIITELTLISRQEKASAAVRDLTTS